MSFVDGKKFCNYKSDYIALRDVSDEICRERGVSVLEDAPIHSDGNKNEVWLHKKGKLSHRDMLKRDIEYCLKYSCNREQFEAQLKGLGYTIDATRMSIKGKGWERAVRLSNLGYTKDILNERLNENYDTPNFYYIWLHHQPYYPKRFPLDKMLRELEFEIEHSYNTATVMVDVLFYVIITLFEIIHKMQIEFLSPELRHAEKDIKQYIADYHFITDNKIRTISELSADIQKTEKEIAEFEHARSLADNKKRRSKTPEEKQQYKDERKGITSHIEPLRKRLKQEKRIFDESPHLYELLQKEHKFEKQEIERIKSNEWSR